MTKSQQSNQPLNLVFLGCGFATSLHSKNLSHFKKNINCYFASRTQELAKKFNDKFKGRGFFDSYESAIRAENIDVVFVATPPVFHLDLTIRALQAGKHVIVEKPPFLKSADFAEVRKASGKSNRRVLVAENYFYKPLALKLREIIESRVIGEILFVHINALKMQTTNNWRDDVALAGGGALFEGGIHWINFISNLGLTVQKIHGLCPGLKKGLEKSILVNYQFEEGAAGTLYYSWETPSLLKGLRISKIYGKKGSITFESNGLFIIIRGLKKRIIFPGIKDIAGYKAMFQDFIEALQMNKEPEFNFEMAEQDLILIETIYESIKS